MPSENFKFEIVKQLGKISEPSPKGWFKEVNLVKWGENPEPKYDIRDWSPDHSRMGRGVTMTKSEVEALIKVLKEPQKK